MNPPVLQALAEKLAGDVAAQCYQIGEPATAPVERYLSADWLARERGRLFLSKPLVLAHASELPAPGAVLRHDALGLPLLLTRDAQGRAHGFLNVCRHRGMRLVEEGSCSRKTLVCPYHGWTYELDGCLRHIPHPEFFPNLVPSPSGQGERVRVRGPEGDAGTTRLVSIPVEQRAGLIWGIAQPGAKLNLDEYLGPLPEELEFFGLNGAAVFRRTDVVRRCNWKLIIEAFLEAYHIRVLHRDTIYRFFLDSAAASEHVGPHIRSVAARRAISEAANIPRAQWNLRELCTFTYFLFPNTVFIFHPDYSSLITLYPLAPDSVRWVHRMLVPKAELEPRREHWEKSFELIENGVFQGEDLFASEGIQAGMASGANTHLNFGRLEFLLGHLHRTIQRELEG